ncbi:MAG: hypothetical protein Q7J27_13615 [Syntrophales bacterium]|nr:hypothetical protein [Syntrophales bacterium]
MTKNLTIDQSFQKFLTNLNPTDKQRERIQKTRDSIDAALINDDRISLCTSKQISFLTGSYSRKTIIRPIDDIDLYVRVHYGKHAKDQSPMSILRLMASAIRKRYPKNTKVNIDSPCIVVRFFGYKFEIVPAVGYSDDPDLYSIPVPGSKEWMYCYPNVPDKWLSACNHANNSLFIPLIKMLKQWNRNNKVGLKSFHLELLTEKVFGAVTDIYSYPQGIYDWIYCVRDWVWGNNYPFVLEPGKSYTYVDEYLYEKPLRLRVVRKRLDAGLKKAERAWDFYSKRRYPTAKRVWNHMFGPKFPVPQVPTTMPSLIPPQPPPTPTLKDFLAPQPSTGLLGKSYGNSLLGALSNPKPKPQPNTNALLGMLLNPKDPFKK